MTGDASNKELLASMSPEELRSALAIFCAMLTSSVVK